MSLNKILVADIFGRTPDLEQLAAHIQGDVILLDPYQGRRMDFANEHDAYRYFGQQVGLNRYTSLLQQHLVGLEGTVSLLGFSVGASAIWRLAGEVTAAKVTGALGLYGGQIRYHLDVEPVFPVKLVFPSSEPHFSVTRLIFDLANKNKLEIAQVNFQHGFINRHSNNFDARGYELFSQALGQLPSEVCFSQLSFPQPANQS